MSDYTPPIPCREEVLNVLRFVRDSLEADELFHFTEQAQENPNTFQVAALDDDNHVNGGFVGWDEAAGKVTYAVFDPVRATHNEQEGVPEDESLNWWQPDSAEAFVMALTGQVREITAYERALELAGGEEKPSDSASQMDGRAA